MKKSTILLIILIYLASIVVIGFFGMKIKVYDEIKYVKNIEMSVEAENENMFTFIDEGIDEATGNRAYKLVINFENYLIGSFTRKNGLTEERKYVPLTLIPYVTYDTGDVANSEEESIKYSISNNVYIDKEYVSLSERGQLLCFKTGIAFIIYVEPASKGGNGTGAIISVYVN